jgi:hypothetical protein
VHYSQSKREREREREKDVAENEYLNKTAVCLSTTKCTRGEICRCFFMILYCALPESYLNAYSLGERDSLPLSCVTFAGLKCHPL